MSAIPRIEVSAPTTYSVSAVAGAISRLLASAPDGWIEGEVRQINVNANSGHCYLTLADEDASLDAIIWRSDITNCRPLPKAGDLVQAHWRNINFYARRGQTSLIIDELQATGEGELLRRRQQTLARLQADGLCDTRNHKALLPFPRVVGVIAGENSDAQVDVVRALQKRFPPQNILFTPALVQGVDAVGSIIDALGRLQDQPGVDTIVLARGGGSVADLAAFDDERLCRAIFACAVPVITSIGHTQNRPNCDHVGAAYAPVPAAAAELAIAHSAEDLLAELERSRHQLAAEVASTLDVALAEIERLREHLQAVPGLAFYHLQLTNHKEVLATRPHLALQQQRGCLTAVTATLMSLLIAALRQLPSAHALDVYATQLQAVTAQLHQRIGNYQRSFLRLHALGSRDLKRQLHLDREHLAQTLALLEAKDFRALGYALVSDTSGKAVKSVAGLHTGEGLRLRFADGAAATVITTIDLDKLWAQPKISLLNKVTKS